MQRTYYSVLKADTKNILRDSSLILILVVPFLMIPLVRYGGAALIRIFPLVAPYANQIITLFGAMVAVFPAFVMGFVMMDEKDGGLNQVLRVLPFSLNKLIGLRVVTMLGLGTVNSYLLFTLNGIVQITAAEAVVLSVNVALFAPIAAFIMLCMSANKVEAAAVLKGINFITLIGFTQVFIPSGYKYLLGPIPTFWAYRAIETIGNPLLFGIHCLAGIALQLVYIWVLWKIFLKKW